MLPGKKIIAALALLYVCPLFGSGNFFIGTKASFGKVTFKTIQTTPDHNVYTYKDKQFYSKTDLVFGGTIKNICISSGIGYNLYHKEYFGGSIDRFMPYIRMNYHILAIPLHVDYNLNVYKSKLFVIMGTGGEYNLVVAQQHKSSISSTFPLKDLKKNYNVHSFLVTFRTGLSYRINPRFEIYSTFDYGFMPTKFMPPKNIENIADPGTSKSRNYTLSGSVGLNILLNKDTTKQKTKKPAK